MSPQDCLHHAILPIALPLELSLEAAGDHLQLLVQLAALQVQRRRRLRSRWRRHVAPGLERICQGLDHRYVKLARHWPLPVCVGFGGHLRVHPRVNFRRGWQCVHVHDWVLRLPRACRPSFIEYPQGCSFLAETDGQVHVLCQHEQCRRQQALRALAGGFRTQGQHSAEEN